MTAASSHESPATTLRYRVGDIVRYVGSDARWVGQQGPVTRADYASHPDVPLVVDLPGGPKGIGVCFAESNVEMVTPAALTLFDFLLARIAAKESSLETTRLTMGETPREEFESWSWVRAQRIECESQRRIVESCRTDYEYAQSRNDDTTELAEEVLQFLALPYADHPDCREEWKP